MSLPAPVRGGRVQVSIEYGGRLEDDSEHETVADSSRQQNVIAEGTFDHSRDTPACLLQQSIEDR